MRHWYTRNVTWDRVADYERLGWMMDDRRPNIWGCIMAWPCACRMIEPTYRISTAQPRHP